MRILTILMAIALLFLTCTQLSAENGRLRQYQGFFAGNPLIDDPGLYWNKSNDELNLLRNEIYASYGRAFVTKRYREYFSQQSWYRLNPGFDDTLLTENDRYNAGLLLALTQDNAAPSTGILNAISEFNAQKDGKESMDSPILTLVFAGSKVTFVPGSERYFGGTITTSYQIRGKWLRLFTGMGTLYVQFETGQTTHIVDYLFVYGKA